MRHRVEVKKLSKTPAHRKAMIRNMLTSLYRYERIKTTLAKSKVLQRIAERLITRAGQDTVHNRRMVAKWVQDKEILNKLFTEIAPKYIQRLGGYSRIVKIGPRYGDAAEMVYIALVEDEVQESSNPKSKKQNRSKKVDVGKETKTKNKSVETKVIPDDSKSTLTQNDELVENEALVDDMRVKTEGEVSIDNDTTDSSISLVEEVESEKDS